MCLKKQQFQADCVYKLGVYKKKIVYSESKLYFQIKSVFFSQSLDVLMNVYGNVAGLRRHRTGALI